MTTLRPHDQQKHEELSQKLSQTIFRNPEDFIMAYNENWINKNNDEVKMISEEIVALYKNVDIKNRTFVFISGTEHMIEELLNDLSPWRSITKLKRMVKSTYDSSKHGRDLYLSEGYVYYLSGEDYVKLSNEKVYRLPDIETIYSKFSSYYEQGAEAPQVSSGNPYLEDEDADEEHDDASADEEETSEIYEFRASDLTEIDTSFIEKMYALMEQKNA